MELTAETLIGVLNEMVTREKSGGLDPSQATAPYGSQVSMTWTKWREARKGGYFQNIQVKETSGISSNLLTGSLYGCTGIFGLCGPDEVIGLTMRDDPFIEWLGFFPDTICEKFIKGWTYMDQEGTAAGTVVGTVYGAACDDPPMTEKGICEFFIGDYGTLRACGETVNITETGMRKCDKQPTYTIPVEGVGPIRIDNDLDLETIAASQTVKHELSRLTITGDKTVTGQFEGLVNLVKVGYVSIEGERCTSMDSQVVDWSNDDLGGAVNGLGSIITTVRDMWRRIRWRIQQTAMGAPQEGDVVLLMPTWMSWEFLDEWAFWSFRETNPVNTTQVVYRDAYELRDYRDKYANGLFGGGFITIDGFNIHVIAHDWMPIDQSAPNFCADIYLLTRRIGNKRVFQGHYMPSDLGADAVAKYAGQRYFNVEAMQGGRALRWFKYENACVQSCLLIRPRLYLECPWAQGVIQNVCVPVQLGPDSLDPQSTYFIETNKVAATPITQYWYNVDDGNWFT